MQKAKNHKFVALRRHVGAILRSRLGAASVLGVSSLLLWAAGCSGDIEESSAPKQTTDALRTEDLASLSPLERIEKLAAPRVPVNVLYSATIGENGEALDVSSQVLPGAEAVEPPPELPPASAEQLPLPQRILRPGARRRRPNRDGARDARLRRGVRRPPHLRSRRPRRPPLVVHEGRPPAEARLSPSAFEAVSARRGSPKSRRASRAETHWESLLAGPVTPGRLYN